MIDLRERERERVAIMWTDFDDAKDNNSAGDPDNDEGGWADFEDPTDTPITEE